MSCAPTSQCRLPSEPDCGRYVQQFELMCIMKATFKPPRGNYYGNLLWNSSEVAKKSNLIADSLDRIRKLGYYASQFPEGDGISFGDETKSKKDIGILVDFRSCFEWLDISFSPQKATTKSPQPTLGYEEDSILSKAHIALAQLEDAIELFLNDRRVSAITLAGAADGIFSGLLKQQGISSPAEETWERIKEIREITGLAYAGDRTQKDAFNEWNETRNSIKHHDARDEGEIKINVFDQACYAIQRANYGAEKLGLVVRNREEYENWLIVHVFM